MKIDIFKYIDPNLFIRDAFRKIKAADSKKSLKWIKNHLPEVSESQLRMIVSNQRLPSDTTVRLISEFLKLEKNESEYFEILCARKRVKDDHKSLALFDKKIEKMRRVRPVRQIAPKTFEQICSVECASLLAYYFAMGSKLTEKQVNQKFLYATSFEEIDKALKLLIASGLMEETNSGLKSKDEDVSVDVNRDSKVIKEFHTKVLNLAAFSLINRSSTERYVASNFIRVKKSAIDEMMSVLRDYEKDFRDRFEVDDGDYVYCLANQYFPIIKE